MHTGRDTDTIDAERRRALSAYAVLDTSAEADFDDLVTLASQLCDMPVSLISLLDGDRQWFKAETGLGRRETPITSSICAHAVKQRDLFVIPDTTKDDRTADNPLVTGAPHVRFYAGVPLQTPEGVTLGTLCVLDTRPREVTPAQAFALRTLARQVMTQLNLRRALKERREGDQRNAAILESAVDYAIISMDLEGIVTSWKGGAETILGWTEPEMLGRHAHVFFTEEDTRDGIPEQEMGAALLYGRGNDERWHRRKDGGRFWASGEMMPLRTADGTPEGFVKILRDRTGQREAAERQRADAALLRDLNDTLEARVLDRTSSLALSEARLRTYFDHSPEGLAVFRRGEDGRFVFDSVNPSFRAMYAIGDREVRARPPGEFTTSAAADEVQRHLEGCVASGRVVRYRAQRSIEGRARVIDVVMAPVPPTGRAEAPLVVGSMRDITDAEKLEEQLRQSQKMEAVGQLTGGIAHDFNNLLTGIGGSLDLMGTRIAQGRFTDLERYITAAQGAANRAAALTHRLLAFSRRQPLDPKPVRGDRLVADMGDLIRRTVGPSIEVDMGSDPDLWTALCDPNQLENAILNLSINARDAMPDGGRLTIRTANVEVEQGFALLRDMPPGRFVALSVTDTGTGMPPDVVARAFDPFFTTKPIGAGTGLGLSMVYGFAGQSGGQVRIHSVEGAGTTVTLYLPKHGGEVDGERDAAGPDDVPQGGAGETVLVVDDEPTVRMLVTDALQELGYVAVEAAEGASALQVLQSNARVDLLVTDVGLPGGMNGRQVADAARLRRPGLKVLFITGYAEGGVVSQANLEPGMQVMTKPFGMDALATRIRSIITDG